MISPGSREIASAIEKIESKGGVYCGRGRSGESGCYQFMPETWKRYAKEIIGYVPEQNLVNEKYVVLRKVEKWKRQGYSPKEIALLWNQGNAGACDRGINQQGVHYDSCDYKQKIVRIMEGSR